MSKASPRADLACQALRQAIIEHALTPGTKLPEDEIGVHFGMSRTLVRATLARLHAEGLVETRPKRTATVAQPTLKEAEEVFSMRRVLEREVVRLAAERWRAESGAELESHIRKEESAKAAGEDRVSIRLAGEFHIALAALTGNGLLQRYLGELVSRSSLILATFARPHSSECAINEHREIIDALRRRDGAKAIALMDKHIGAVAHRALLTDQPSSKLDLGTVLSMYTAAKARSSTVELRSVTRGPKR